MLLHRSKAAAGFGVRPAQGQQGQDRQGPAAVDDVSDWYIPHERYEETVIYPGPTGVPEHLAEDAKAIHDDIVMKIESGEVRGTDFRIAYKGVSLRVHCQKTADGMMYMLRRLTSKQPSIEELRLPREYLRILLHDKFGQGGGLVVICGMTGHGKTTTCSAVVLERVKKGGFCLTVEDPPEFPLHGNYPTPEGRMGKIVQIPVEGRDFAEALHDSLRCYPSNQRRSMLMVGEVRNAATAAEMLRAAVNGQLVFTTVHAADPIAALERLLAMAKEAMGPEEAQSLLSHSLRAIIKQTMVNGLPHMDGIFSVVWNSEVAARVKRGELHLLSTSLNQQRTLINQGRLLESLFAEAATSGMKNPGETVQGTTVPGRR